MTHAFISYVEEDSAVAEAVAAALAAKGLTSWRYQTNSIPGPSYLAQASRAISSSQVFVLIISDESLRSQQVSREVDFAHEAGRPFVPVLHGISHAEFQKRQPSWRMAVGTATTIRLQQPFSDFCLQRICAGVEAQLVSNAAPESRVESGSVEAPPVVPATPDKADDVPVPQRVPTQETPRVSKVRRLFLLFPCATSRQSVFRILFYIHTLIFLLVLVTVIVLAGGDEMSGREIGAASIQFMAWGLSLWIEWKVAALPATVLDSYPRLGPWLTKLLGRIPERRWKWAFAIAFYIWLFWCVPLLATSFLNEKLDLEWDGYSGRTFGIFAALGVFLRVIFTPARSRWLQTGLVIGSASTVLLLFWRFESLDYDEFFGSPFANDTIKMSVNKPRGEVAKAIRDAIQKNGSVSTERAREDKETLPWRLNGSMFDRRVWVKIEKGTTTNDSVVRIQVRSNWGIGEPELARELERQVSERLQ